MCASMEAARVRFAEGPNDILTVVEIDAPLSAGGPDATWRALFELRTQILSAQLRVVGDRLLQTLHLAELDGKVLDEMRGRQIKSRLEHTFGDRLPTVAEVCSSGTSLVKEAQKTASFCTELGVALPFSAQ
jgi:hypothetical protein